MKTLTIGQALQDTTIDLTDHYLYLVKDEETIFYIGQSFDPINRFQEHLGLTWRGHCSPTGMIILENAPASNQWTIDFFTLSDCESLLNIYLLPRMAVVGYTLKRYYDPHFLPGSIDFAEQSLIMHYCPCLNVTYNTQPSSLPEKYTHVRPGTSSTDFLRV